MPAVLSPPQQKTSNAKRALFSCDQFHNMGDAGGFEGRSVILVDGEILEMPNPNPPHDTAVTLTDYLLKDLFKNGFIVRIQTGFPTSTDTDPVPDLAVVPGHARDYSRKHPRKAVLVVEVADSSLAYDRNEKADLYAAAGIADYWVIDVVNRQLLVFRDPKPDALSIRNFTYQTRLALDATETVSPLAMPTANVAVADLLP